jgi:two-component system CheB/CheR fusion protein
MMAALLSEHTPLTVLEAREGMAVAPGHFYVIPPGAYLSVAAGFLHLSQPKIRRAERLPFDFLLYSLAETYGTKAVCIVLSGSGADGSLGVRDVKAKGGFIMVQRPGDAGYDGMPQNAIDTGDVNLVLPVAEISEALQRHVLGGDAPAPKRRASVTDATEQVLTAIIVLVRQQTSQDFNYYKRGTLRRRVERRMAMASIGSRDMAEYLSRLRNDPDEVRELAKDLLINVTSFFRDPKVFDILERKIIPEMVHSQVADEPLRIWTVGCSTGEEAYSLVMLFHEYITKQRSNVRLQMFASDLDADAVATAREGLYPIGIKAAISEARLKRFFVEEEHGYRVIPEVRAAVVFAVQDMLVDPPFSRLDLVSCRNLLIYLLPEAQARAISLFHFALRKNGILLLGSAETVGKAAGRFEVLSEEARLYRHVGRSRPGDIGFSMIPAGAGRPKVSALEEARPVSRQVVLADLGRRLVLERHAPAALLINRRSECVFSLGPTDLYFRMAPGISTLDVLAMARPGFRAKLGAAIQQAIREKKKIVIKAARIIEDGQTTDFDIEVEPVPDAGEELLLICFLNPSTQMRRDSVQTQVSCSRRLKVDSEGELEALRAELQNTIRDLELSSEEQKAINQEALSVNEEHQSTNEELMTSKEEMQSLNEELTALNSQLQETLERQRTTSDDLQNVLYSTDVATLFLDKDLNIRFFTPATKSLFAIIPGDIGRPIADLQPATPDATLSGDARSVLKTLEPIEREIQTLDGIWFRRRMLPYRTSTNTIEGVVITFTDVTKRIHASEALKIARQQADAANITKSKFLAAASHDLRQPLQTMSLLQGLLAKVVEGKTGQGLVERLDATLSAMSIMLNTLLDINQIDAGIVHPIKIDFPIDDFLARIRDEFFYHAEAKGLQLIVVPCSLSIHTDPRLLEQMVRNLVSNAMKYTEHGRVLIGCRRQSDWLSLQVWDTGIGIPAEAFDAIFEEYHQLDNPARERSRGLGLGLSIVRRLGVLLHHRIGIHSTHGSGSMFSIDIPLVRQALKDVAA